MLRVVELFAGIGAQATALENLGIEHQCTISEIDDHAIAMYNAIHGDTPNLGDITKIEHLPECDLITWSFPCQSISLAGKREGMEEGSGTRSSLGWEVIRLVKDAESRGCPPRFMLMENVPAITLEPNLSEFMRMIAALSEIGYVSRYKILNALDFDVPQNRRRCFMVSEYKGEPYIFPKGKGRTRILSDILEHNVDESYYLSDERVQRYRTHHDSKSSAPESVDFRWPNIRGYEDYDVGDGLVPSRPFSTRKSVQHGVSFAIAATATPAVAVSEDDCTRKIPQIKEGEVACIQNPGFIHANQWGKGFKTNGTSYTLRAEIQDGIMENIGGRTRIRYLTERECWRLMGFDDDRIDRAFSIEPSKNARYKAAGNSIVVPVLEAIFSRMLTEKGRTTGQMALSAFFPTEASRCPARSGTRTATQDSTGFPTVPWTS